MPSLSQLQAEIYWNDEVVPPAIDWLGDNLCTRTNRPRTAFGCKGDVAHLRGAHRSQRWLLNSRWATNRTYTVQTGLTYEQSNWCAGVDFTPGSVQQMIAQCRRIKAAMVAGQLDEVLEFYGNVDGDQIVDGWDNLNDRAATSDSSHLWHWHLTINRRHANNLPLMQRILATALGDTMALTQAEIAAIAEAVKNIRTGMGPATPTGFTFAQLLLGAATQAQVNALQAKVDSLLTQIGALTVAVANVQHKLDDMSQVPDLIIEPVQLTGELRFGTNDS